MTLSQHELARDLSITFPGLKAEPAAEDVAAFLGPKLWFQSTARMPDGWPLCLDTDAPDYVPGYTHMIHDGLRSWVEMRGWAVMSYAGVHPSLMGHLGISPAAVAPGLPVQLLVPLTTVEAAIAEHQQMLGSVAAAESLDAGSP